MTFKKPVVFSGFLHQFKNRENIADILLTVTLNTIILAPNTENLYKMIKIWDNRANENGLGTTYFVFYSFEIHRRCPLRPDTFKTCHQVQFVTTLSAVCPDKPQDDIIPLYRDKSNAVS